MTNQLLHSVELISICICTFRRPQGLMAALDSVAAQKFPVSVEIEVVVVDNDPNASGHSVYNSFQNSHPTMRIVYANETTPGISFARNRCLKEASGSWIAFLDDDEQASEIWLSTLWNAAHVHNADATFGPVLPVYEGVAPVWLISACAHERPRFRTGTKISWGDARSGNVLMTRSVVEMVGCFDKRFAKTGGEDSFFFACALKDGAKLVWCDEAVVNETVPQSRMTQLWVIKRAFYGGRTYARLNAAIDGYFAYFKLFTHGFGILLILSLPVFVMWLLQCDKWLKYVRKLAGAAGKVVAPIYNAGEYGQ